MHLPHVVPGLERLGACRVHVPDDQLEALEVDRARGLPGSEPRPLPAPEVPEDGLIAAGDEAVLVMENDERPRLSVGVELLLDLRVHGQAPHSLLTRADPWPCP